MDNTFIQEKLLHRLTFNPELALTEQPGPGDRFSKAPETFRARKAIAKSRILRVQSCFIRIF